MPEKSLAATLIAEKEFEIREFDVPEIDQDSGILRVDRTGVCGSDVSQWVSMKRGTRIMGHEIVGTVAKIGDAASQRWKVKEGDRVVLEEYMPCHACEFCLGGDYRFCHQTDITLPGDHLFYGSTPLTTEPKLWGGYSQYLYLHPNAVVHRLPSHVPLSEAAFFLPLSNGFEWTCVYGGIGVGKSVVIQGPGQQGLACVLAAKTAGAEHIIVSGISSDQTRLSIAEKIGADCVVNVEEDDLVERVNEVTNGRGVDAVVNVTGGAPGTVAEAMKMTRLDGVVVLAGAGNQQISTGDGGRKNLTLKWANGHSYRSVELAVACIASGKYPISDISTHHFGLKDVALAIQSVAGEGVPGAIHVSVDPWE